MASSRSTNSWRAASSSRTRSSSSSNLASISARPVPERSTPASRRRASAASVRLVSVSGNRPRSVERLGGLAAVDEDPGQALGGADVVRLELEGLAERGLVTGLGQRVRLARRRRQPLHEGGDLRLGHRTDELVHHLALTEREDGGDGLHVEGLRHRRVVVDVDLGQLDGAAGVGHRFLQHRPEGLAGPAPLGPEVHNDRHRRTAVQNLGLECLICDVHRPRR